MLKKILFIIHLIILLLFALFLPAFNVFAKEVIIDDDTQETQTKGNLRATQDNSILYLNQLNDVDVEVSSETNEYFTWFYAEYSHVYLVYFNTDCFRYWQIYNDTTTTGTWFTSANATLITAVDNEVNTPRYYVKLSNLTNRYVLIRNNKTTAQYNGTRFHINIIDLTEMYGTGNEPLLSDCRNIFGIDYLPYAPLSDKILILSTYTTAYQTGYLTGFNEGYDQGIAENITSTSWVENVFNAISSFLNIEILPNATIGLIVGIPFLISLTWFVIKTWRGGGD